ncbi:MAG: polyprenyl synthetase family protein [Clostridia bacterium]|nr:polyprenyl synthetase family protein [Clostridia bacterium]
MNQYKSAVEAYLESRFTEDLPQRTLFDAMRYSLLAGGKRIRPCLALESCRVCGGAWEKATPLASAPAMIHTYSLIHDDLPCMDNDDYRRGRLTNHKVFGDAMAVLAGDGLLTAAFSTATSADADAKTIVDVVSMLSVCAGETGMVGGQVLDLEGEGKHLEENQIWTIHALKTGALIRAACCIGVIAGHGTEKQLAAAGTYADSLGLAFQIRDDMLDVLGDAEKLGKATHMDEKKSTFVSLYGVGKCAQMIEKETNTAINALEVFDDREFLICMANKLAIREY